MKKILMVSVMMVMVAATARGDFIASKAYVDQKVQEQLGNLSEDIARKQDSLTSSGAEPNVSVTGSGVVKSFTAVDGELTFAKGSVGNSDIGTGAVTSGNFAANSVTGAKMQNGAVTANKLASNIKIGMAKFAWPTDVEQDSGNTVVSGEAQVLTLVPDGNGGYNYQWEPVQRSTN